MTERQRLKGIRRVPPPATLAEAYRRLRRARQVVQALERAREMAREFPHTRRYIGRCLKSAIGALNHASRMHEARFHEIASRDRFDRGA